MLIIPNTSTDNYDLPNSNKGWLVSIALSFLIILLTGMVGALLFNANDDNQSSLVSVIALSIASIFLALRFPGMLALRRISLEMTTISILAGIAINLIPAGSGTTHLLPYLSYGLSNKIVFIVFICFLLPVIEEIYFRGLLYPIISKYIGFKAAALITVTLFILGHSPSLSEVLLLGLSATLYTWLVHRTGSVISGILAHSFGNSAWLILAIASQQS